MVTMGRHAFSVASALSILLGIALPADAEEPRAVDEPPGVLGSDVDEDCAEVEGSASSATVSPRAPSVTTAMASQSVAPAIAPPRLPSSVPSGRAIGQLSASQCRAVLADLGIEVEDASGEGGPVSAVPQPIRLRGPIGTLTVRPSGGDPRSIHAILDCRLAVALYAWSPTLRAAGFVGIEHVSVFRPGARVAASGHPSGHAHALAIDALRFVRADGTTFSVLDDWVARARGGDPCSTYDEPTEARALREAICAGAAAELFEVIITPHHDDPHANHVHLEVVPGVDWTVIR
jgi:hypothetical protein